MAPNGNAARVDPIPSEPESVSAPAASAMDSASFAPLPPFEPPADNPFVPPYLREKRAAAPPETPNPYTPLALPKQPPAKHRHMTSLPPVPGQRYSYVPPSMWVDSPLGTSWESTGEDYQQAYWEHLQSVAPPQAPAPSEDTLLVDEEPQLYNERLPGASAEMPQSEDWPCDLATGNDEPPAPSEPPATYAPMPNLPYANSRAGADIATPYEAYRQYNAPLPQPPVPPRRAPRLALWQRFLAYLAPGGKSRKALNPVSVVMLAVGLVLDLLAICSLCRIASEFSQAQQENRAWRESYFGGKNAAVNQAAMPQNGATFAPSAPPTAAPTRAPRPQADSAQPTALPRPTAAPAGQQRGYRQSYEGNPELIVSDRFLQLRRENQDIIGWLKLGALDQPVMQRDNTYYQTHDRTGTYSALGAPYLHSAVTLKRPPENLLISGNSGGGAVFDELLKYESGGVDHLRKNAFFTLDTVYESAQYVIFAVFPADTNPASSQYFGYASYLSFPTDAAFQSYVAAACARSLYRVNVDIAPTDALCTLCTTGKTGGTSRLIVLARRLRPSESAAQAPQITPNE